MKEIRQITCIRCPMGCQLTVELTDGVVTKVEGNECNRGVEYAKTECVNPVRTLTTTVRTAYGVPLPVRSKDPIPKDRMFDAMRAVNSVMLVAPVNAGDVIIPDVCGTGVDIVASVSLLDFM